jgi:hypothetical protein
MGERGQWYARYAKVGKVMQPKVSNLLLRLNDLRTPQRCVEAAWVVSKWL